MWHLALATGLRRGELLGLEWGDVDLVLGRLTVHRNRVDAGSAGIVEGTAKTGKGRTLALDPATVAVLEEWRTWQNVDRAMADEGWTETGKVFTHEDGRALDPISLRWAFQVALREWGGRKVRFHDTRHTHASNLIAAGVNVKVVQERMGHANIGTTLTIYAHLLPEADIDAAARAAAFLAGSAD